MFITTNDDAFFRSYWATSVGAGSTAIEASLSVEEPVPQGISLENGILQISAWIGKEPASVKLFDDLCNVARRILGVSDSIGDSFEEKFRALLNPAVVGNSTANASGKNAEDVDLDPTDAEGDDAPQPATRNARPTVTTVVIHLICHPDCLESDLSDWSDVFIRWGNNVIRVVVRVIRVNTSNTSDESIPVIDAFSTIFKSGNDQLTVALVRLGDFIPLLALGNGAYAANVRSWLGDNTVTNSRLKDVFDGVANGKGNPTMFPLNHNGVTICCNDMTKSGSGSFHLVNPQIINGQQTLHGWWDAYNAHREPAQRASLEDLVVMVRFVKTQLKSTLDQITFANNRQNAVSAVDLRSNEACMVTIETAFNFSGSKCLFQRKKGIDKLKRLDAGLIFNTWKFIADKSIGAEAFFDEKTQFDSLFVNLAAALTKGSVQDQELRRNRLIGLWQFSRLSFGKAKLTAIADVLALLKVSRTTLGDAMNATKDGPTRQRRLVYALWPKIHQGIMHLMLQNQGWGGVSESIVLLEGTLVGKGKKPLKVWKLTAATQSLLGSLSLPSDLITVFMKACEDWITTEGIDEKDWDPEDLFAEFVTEQVTLNDMLKRMNVNRANLVTDL